MKLAMISLLLLVPLVAAGADPGADGSNPIYHALIASGLNIEGRTIKFPRPLLNDEQSAETQQAQLVELLGSERKVAEFLRDSVSAPFILKLKDETTTGSILRRADLWFAVHASLDSVDFDAFSRQSNDSKPVEVGNMRFESRQLDAAALKERGIEVPASNDTQEAFFMHQTGRLLDRIHVEGTDSIFASRTPRSLVIAAQTDRRFDNDPKAANRWWSITRRAGKEEAGTAQVYHGGASYVVINQLASDPKVLVAEAHFVFAEPRPWFDGSPILRSKISLIAQDQIRHLRREIARKKGGDAAKP